MCENLKRAIMTQKKKDLGIFTEVKVSKAPQHRDYDAPNVAGAVKPWKYIRISYPNGVFITVPSDIGLDELSRYVNLK